MRLSPARNGYPVAMSDELEFFFDPICPFCWVTSRWVVEVGRQREIAVSWRPLPLAILNEGISYDERRKVSEAYPESHRRGLEMLRVIHAAGERHGGIGLARVQAGRVVLGVHRHRADAQVGAGLGDADGDLAAIGDQQGGKGHGRPLRASCHEAILGARARR